MKPETITSAIGCQSARAAVWAGPLTDAMERYEINTPERQAAFLAQIAVESGRLLYVREIWGPTKWQVKYEGHVGLGNTVKGDGRRFCGRGLIQVTGRTNYDRCGKALGLDLLNAPELLELPQHAAMSAAWFWKSNGLNELADEGEIDKITRRINGPGMLGADDRKELYGKAMAVL
jgi:putative chitinase